MNSIRFEELNKKCKKLKRKKIFKLFLITFFSIVIIILLYLLFHLKADKESNISKKISTQKVKKIAKIKQDRNSTTVKLMDKRDSPKPVKKKHKIVLKIKKEDKIKKDKILLNPALNIPDLNTSALIKKDMKVPIAKKKIVKLKTKKVQKNQIKKKPFKISVKLVDKESVLIKNYNNLKNYNSALNLAIFYFDKKDYKKCIYWAKIASQLGKTADKPWILYAKAKYNLHQKKDAIKSLQMYLNYFDSKDVYELLRKFKKERK